MLDLAWRPRAHLDRESIAIHLGLERKAPQAALDAMRRIDDAIERVRTFPDSGGRVRLDTLRRTEYRTVLASPYTVYYRFDEKTLTVYRILHQCQNIDTYALVDLRGERAGYDRVFIHNAQIFPGIQTLQQIVLIPTPTLPDSYAQTQEFDIPSQAQDL